MIVFTTFKLCSHNAIAFSWFTRVLLALDYMRALLSLFSPLITLSKSHARMMVIVSSLLTNVLPLLLLMSTDIGFELSWPSNVDSITVTFQVISR